LHDWSVRESFHTVRSLQNQTVSRDKYEIIWVEYYNKKLPSDVREMVDKHIVLDLKDRHFKHRMMNEGLVKASGKIVTQMNSDDLVKPTFIASILETFEKHKNEKIYVQIDRGDCLNQGYFPLDKTKASWEQIITGPGMYEWDHKHKLPRGLVEDDGPFQPDGLSRLRDWGSCFSTYRKDALTFGGHDEDEAYHSYWCGVYELAWRMQNAGWKEVFHPTEYTLHVWHPETGWPSDPKIDDVWNRGVIETGTVNKEAFSVRNSGRIFPTTLSPTVREYFKNGGRCE